MRSTPPVPRKLTVSELARLWGVSRNKIHAWIRGGELRAINVASRRGGRPCYRIDRADLAAFEAGRQVLPAAAPVARRRRQPQKVTEYF